jgi:hypothetical protein
MDGCNAMTRSTDEYSPPSEGDYNTKEQDIANIYERSREYEEAMDD